MQLLQTSVLLLAQFFFRTIEEMKDRNMGRGVAKIAQLSKGLTL